MYTKVEWSNKRVSEMLPFKNGSQANKEQFIKVLASCIKQKLQK